MRWCSIVGRSWCEACVLRLAGYRWLAVRWCGCRWLAVPTIASRGLGAETLSSSWETCLEVIELRLN